MLKFLTCLYLTLFLQLLLTVECLYAGDPCNLDGQDGECTRLSICQPLLIEIQRAGRPIPPHIRRRLQSLTCGFQSDEPIVCCPNQGFTTTSTTVSPWYDDASIEKPDDGNRRDVVENELPPDVRRHPNLRLLPSNCGTIEDNKIWGGNRTHLYEMPWMVLIAYESARGIKLSCGGTLISERYVLTAAHCVSFLGSRLQLNGIVLGEYDVQSDPDCERVEGTLQCAPSARNVSIQSVIPHPGYSPQKLFDDIALVRLAEPADFTLESMKPICLPVTPELQNQPLNGLQGVVAGWGATEDGVQSNVLLSVQLPILSNKECQAAYNGSPHIYDRQLCAGGVEDKDSCGGDSGGPLLYPGSIGPLGARYVQRGIVSFGSKRCGLGGFPGVYTRVAHYMEWILDNMRS